MPRPDRVQTIRNYQGGVTLIRRRLQVVSNAAWRSLGGSYRDGDIDRLVGIMVPQTLAAQRQVAGLTDAYVAAVLGGRARGIDRARVTGAAVRGGADPLEVYRRPGIAVYTALSRGQSLEKAAGIGLLRLLSLTMTDIQLAKREQSSESLQAAQVETYRRVLSGSEGCALCVEAADEVYYSADLMPIHPGCDCDVEPDTEGSVAETLNASADDVAATADLAERGIDPDSTEPLVAVHEHGEYGPTLAWAGDDFTGPDDLAA